MKRAVLYVRVSTSKQEEGYSIPLQKSRLIAYCKAKGWVVSGVFVDPGHSGSSLERPGIAGLMEGVKAGKYDVVLVYKLDRLSRSQKDTLYLIEDIFMANKVDFVSMQESFDTSTVFGRGMVGILSVFSQMERETITERTLMGRAGRAEEGLWHGGGTAPIAYDYIDGELVINEEEAQQVREVYSLFDAGFTVTEITRKMEGCTTKHGDWSYTSTVGNVLDNPLYAGVIRFDGVKAKGQHKPIIDAELNKRVKSRRARLRRLDAVGDSKYLLTSFIYCDCCGARYFPNRRPNGKVVYSCHSRAKKNKQMVKDPNCKAPHIPIDELDAMVEANVLRLAAEPSRINEVIEKRASWGGDSLDGNKSDRLQQIDEEISKLMDLYQYDQLIHAEEVAARIATLYAEREKIRPTSDDYKVTKYDIESAKMLLRDISSNWDVVEIKGRRAFLVQLIDYVFVDAEKGVRIEWAFN